MQRPTNSRRHATRERHTQRSRGPQTHAVTLRNGARNSAKAHKLALSRCKGNGPRSSAEARKFACRDNGALCACNTKRIQTCVTLSALNMCPVTCVAAKRRAFCMCPTPHPRACAGGTSASDASRGVPLRSAAALPACAPCGGPHSFKSSYKLLARLALRTAQHQRERPLRVRSLHAQRSSIPLSKSLVYPLPMHSIPCSIPSLCHCISSGRNVRGRLPRPANPAPARLRTQT